MTEQLDLTSLRGALIFLEQSLDVVGTRWFAEQSEVVRRTLLAGVIQNYEFVYELSVKMLRRQLELEAGSPTEVDESSFRNLLRVAGEKGLIAKVENWFGYRRMRNITAHTYDPVKARQVYEASHAFVVDARALLGALESRNA